MGACLVVESLALLKWCERLGFGPFGNLNLILICFISSLIYFLFNEKVLTGMSMGGHVEYNFFRNNFFIIEINLVKNQKRWLV
jgi:hypothetical protein